MLTVRLRQDRDQSAVVVKRTENLPDTLSSPTRSTDAISQYPA
jgi:hypothetical protein